MNEQQWIKSLDRDGATPDIDVANSVLRDIRAREARQASDPFALAALLATLAGGSAVVLAAQAFLTFSDPFTGFLDAFKLVLQ